MSDTIAKSVEKAGTSISKEKLLEAIRKFYYADVSALLVLIISTVMVIDALTERVRHRLLGQEREA